MTPKTPFLEGTFWDKFWRPFWVSRFFLVRKIPAPIKIKSALPPPPPPKKKPKYPPPPLKRGILRTQVFLQKEGIFPGVRKIGAAISGPRIADTNFTDTRIFLIWDFPDLSGDSPDIFPIRPFSLSRPIKSTCVGTVPKGSAGTIWTFPKKSGKPPRFGNPPVPLAPEKQVFMCSVCEFFPVISWVKFLKVMHYWLKFG